MLFISYWEAWKKMFCLGGLQNYLLLMISNLIAKWVESLVCWFPVFRLVKLAQWVRTWPIFVVVVFWELEEEKPLNGRCCILCTHTIMFVCFHVFCLFITLSLNCVNCSRMACWHLLLDGSFAGLAWMLLIRLNS